MSAPNASPLFELVLVASSPQVTDKRRKLSSRDLLVIYLASKTHSLRELSKTFKVSSKHLANLLKKGRLRCPICRKWKVLKSGFVLRNDRNPKIILWICRRCIKTECA